MPKKRVVIIGSGFAGLFAARTLRDEHDLDVIMITDTATHLFQPLLYQLATGILSEGEVATPARMIFKKDLPITVLTGLVTAIDGAKNELTMLVGHDEQNVSFDYLVLGAGAQQSYFGNDQFAKFAPGLKTVDEALELRAKIMTAFERAEATDDEEERRKYLTFAIVGAGPTGVEMAGQIAELARTTLSDAYRNISADQATIYLFDAVDRVLPMMTEKQSARTEANLAAIGVKVVLGAKVTDVTADAIVIAKGEDTETIPAYWKLWSAGVAASPLGKQVAEQGGSEFDRAGRVKVEADLTVKEFPNIFVVGDMMLVPGVPGIAPAAIQSGKYAAKTILADVAGHPREPFHYVDKGTISIVSRFNAVGNVFGNRFKVSGFIGWVLWLFIHLFYLVGYRNKVSALVSWLYTFGIGKRSELSLSKNWMIESDGDDVPEPGAITQTPRAPKQVEPAPVAPTAPATAPAPSEAETGNPSGAE